MAGIVRIRFCLICFYYSSIFLVCISIIVPLILLLLYFFYPLFSLFLNIHSFGRMCMSHVPVSQPLYFTDYYKGIFEGAYSTNTAFAVRRVPASVKCADFIDNYCRRFGETALPRVAYLPQSLIICLAYTPFFPSSPGPATSDVVLHYSDSLVVKILLTAFGVSRPALLEGKPVDGLVSFQTTVGFAQPL